MTPRSSSRIRALAVPPAWTDVWICSDPLGHIQATGLDVKGRRRVPIPRAVAGGAGRREVRSDPAPAKQLPLRGAVTDRPRPGPRRHAPRPRPRARGAPARGRVLPGRGRDLPPARTARPVWPPSARSTSEVRGKALVFDYDAKSGQHLQRVVMDRAAARRRASPPAAAHRPEGRAARLQGRAALGRRPLRGHQRLPPRAPGRRLQREGLPDLGRHRPDRRRPGRP